MRKDIEEAKRLLKKLRETISKRPSPFAGMSEELYKNQKKGYI